MTDALLKIRADSASTVEQRLGLMMCMMAMKGPAAAHVSIYISQLPEQERKSLTGLWKGKLEMLYRRDGVREWLSLYPELINDELLRLVDFLEENDDFDAY